MGSTAGAHYDTWISTRRALQKIIRRAFRRGIHHFPGFSPSPLLIAFILAGFISLTPSLFADTVVSGNVSGEWDLAGSPYLVTDTLTIPEDSTLTIAPGVVVRFVGQSVQHRWLIKLMGSMIATGTDEDSIYFLSDTVAFAGIQTPSLNEHRQSLRLDHVVVDSLWDRIDVANNYRVALLRSRIVLARPTVPVNTHLTVSDSLVDLRFCRRIGQDPSSLGQVIVSPDSFLTVQGVQGAVNLQLNSVHHPVISPIVGNRVYSLRVDHNLPATTQDTVQIAGNSLNSSIILENGAYRVHDNTAASLGGRQMTMEVYACRFHRIGGENGIADLHDNVLIEDSVYTTGYNIAFNGGSVVMRHNLLISPNACIYLERQSGTVVLENNTLLYQRGAFELNRVDGVLTLRNNIFLAESPNHPVVTFTEGSPSGSEPDYNISYNCFSNSTDLGDPAATLGEGNLFANAELAGGEPFDAHLQANSPCIDTGDPASLRDPDSSRADMGAYFYDQRLDNPPVVSSPVELAASSSIPFHYTGTATDDQGFVHVTFDSLPEWLTANAPELDWVSDTASVSGTIPEGTTGFTFAVVATDPLGQQDRQTVHVAVYPYTLLSGEIQGTLTASRSPYYITGDLTVPPGDTLIIEPGCDLAFHYDPNPDRRIGLTCFGALIAEGTGQDSIRFGMLPGEAVTGGWRGLLVADSQATASIAFSRFDLGIQGIVLKDGSFGNTAHSVFLRTRDESIDVLHHSSLTCTANIFYTDERTPSQFIVSSGSTVTVDSSFFIDNEMLSNVSACILADSSMLSVYHTNFYRTRPLLGDYGSHIVFRNNNCYGLLGAVSNGATIIATNNRFIAGDRDYEVALNSSSVNDTIVNNVFQGFQDAIVYYGDLSQGQGSYIENNLFTECMIGIVNHHGDALMNSIRFNCFWQCDSLGTAISLDSTNLQLDPLLADSLFHLFATSPLIDAGDPDERFSDRDGTRNDMGLWGGPNGMDYPYPLSVPESSPEVASSFHLFNPYPNPFNGSINVHYTAVNQGKIYLSLYNLLGRVVLSKDLGRRQQGDNTVTLDFSKMPSGLYVLEVKSKHSVARSKVVLVR